MAVLKRFNGSAWVEYTPTLDDLKAQRAIITCETATAAATVAKVITNSVPLEVNSIVMVTFTNGNTASAITLNYNGGGAKAVRLAGGAPTAASGTGAAYCVAGNKITFIYDGTYFWQLGSQDITVNQGWQLTIKDGF